MLALKNVNITIIVHWKHLLMRWECPVMGVGGDVGNICPVTFEKKLVKIIGAQYPELKQYNLSCSLINLPLI